MNPYESVRKFHGMSVRVPSESVRNFRPNPYFIDIFWLNNFKQYATCHFMDWKKFREMQLAIL